MSDGGEQARQRRALHAGERAPGATAEHDVGRPRCGGDEREEHADGVDPGHGAGEQHDPEARHGRAEQVEPTTRAGEREREGAEELEGDREAEPDPVDGAVDPEVHADQDEAEQQGGADGPPRQVPEARSGDREQRDRGEGLAERDHAARPHEREDRGTDRGADLHGCRTADDGGRCDGFP